jgi:hypothetical protein
MDDGAVISMPSHHPRKPSCFYVQRLWHSSKRQTIAKMLRAINLAYFMQCSPVLNVDDS